MWDIVKASTDGIKPIDPKVVEDAKELNREWLEIKQRWDELGRDGVRIVVNIVETVRRINNDNPPGTPAPDTKPGGTPKSVPEQVADDVVDFVQGDKGGGGSFWGNVLNVAADAAKVLTNPALLATEAIPDTSPSTQAERDAIQENRRRLSPAHPLHRTGWPLEG